VLRSLGIAFMFAFKWEYKPKLSVLQKFTTGGPWISPGLRDVKRFRKRVTKHIDILWYKILFYSLTATKLDTKCSAFHRAQGIITVQIKFHNSLIQILAR
jgi:hypothetical protein